MARLTALLLTLALCCVAQQPPENPPAKGGEIPRQEENKTPAEPETNERWNLFWQATSIGQYHGTFHSPYEGPDSLQDYSERAVSLTTTLFFGLRLDDNTQFYFNPEVAGGRGFSNVDGLANFPNGELPRVASVTPKPYLARLYVQHDFGWGDERESFDSEENQLGGERPVNRYTIAVGRFSVTDFFDNNRYTHDPRTQFMGWAIMYNGTWDYPADTRGYTWGWVHELHTKNWSWRYGSAAEPKVANGEKFDRRIFRDRGDMFEAERRYEIRKHSGAIRALGFLLHTDSGSYQEALKMGEETHTTPDVIKTRQVGRLKYGMGVSFDQELTSDIGVFSRLGWNDGKTESFAFTAMDRLATGGVSVTGTRWHRHFDTAATELTVGGLSAVHAQYLAAGGLDFLIGDGRLNYGPEYVWETYYSARLLPGFFATIDEQRIANPAYNQDRGPLWVSSIRLHIEMGK
ncbi:MAG: carbohydrate porin [Acidobacteriaceae bacterium]|nr:carbohydrate porin [Acidobacteriaceae bacterium]MBV9297291.1 carbohydrate porin [Acidobacteriaceae bacterium]MBV9763541.1 carbohydrate porin [Acidobacteriaceae bacterium]